MVGNTFERLGPGLSVWASTRKHSKLTAGIKAKQTQVVLKKSRHKIQNYPTQLTVIKQPGLHRY